MTDDELTEVQTLRQATERLAEQVATLSVALQTVNHLQERQLATEAKADSAVRTAKAASEDVAENAVSKMEYHKGLKDTVTQTAIARALAQRRLRIFAISVACVALVISLAAVSIAFWVNHTALAVQQRSRVELCTQNNNARIDAANRERDYFAPKLAAELENPHADPVLVSILRQLAEAQADLVACPKR